MYVHNESEAVRLLFQLMKEQGTILFMSRHRSKKRWNCYLLSPTVNENGGRGVIMELSRSTCGKAVNYLELVDTGINIRGEEYKSYRYSGTW